MDPASGLARGHRRDQAWRSGCPQLDLLDLACLSAPLGYAGRALPVSRSGGAIPRQIVVVFGPLSRPRRTPLHLTYTSFSAPGGALCKAYARRSNRESGAL